MHFYNTQLQVVRLTSFLYHALWIGLNVIYTKDSTCILTACDRSTAVTYRYFHAPELTTHLAGHLHGDLCGHAYQHVRSAQCAGQYTLTGNGELHTEVLFHLVILVLPVARKDNHHLTNN